MKKLTEMREDRAESFLKLIQKSNRGRLKIYLGYAAGVGKTYQMLQEAHRLRKANVDVRIGYVETHGRPETQKLTDGLTQIPLREALYHGIIIKELDLDAVLSVNPQVVLVDELAHTNLPGSRNKKRYQDIEEILNAGIHVITALNVQHIESLYETVERLTKVKVKERVPDRIVLEADQIINVDVTAEDLRDRLKEGNIYSKEKIATALENFFQEHNLFQLRELTLRELAFQLDQKQRAPDSEKNTVANDQIVVCLSSQGPDSEALLRYASRLAGKLNRNWYVLYVQTPEESPQLIQPKLQRILANTLNLAQELGATVFQWKGNHIGETILQFSNEYRVSHIILGLSQRKRSLFSKFFSKSILEYLLDHRSFESIIVYSNAIVKEKEVKEEKVLQKKINNQNEIAHKTLLEAEIKIWEKEIGKEEAIDELLSLSHSIKKIPMDILKNAIIEREKLGSTFIGNEIAIPHAKIQKLEKPEICIGIIKDPYDVNFSGFRIMFLLLSPESPAEVHLSILGLIAKLGQDDLALKRITSGTSIELVRSNLAGFLS